MLTHEKCRLPETYRSCEGWSILMLRSGKRRIILILNQLCSQFFFFEKYLDFNGIEVFDGWTKQQITVTPLSMQLFKKSISASFDECCLHMRKPYWLLPSYSFYSRYTVIFSQAAHKKKLLYMFVQVKCKRGFCSPDCWNKDIFHFSSLLESNSPQIRRSNYLLRT